MCNGGDHGVCMFEGAVQMKNQPENSPVTVGDAVGRFSGNMNPDEKLKRIKKLQRTEKILHLIMWGPK
ncbi:hypothetical protein R6Q59_009740 [Mikania micrantha]